MSSDKAPSRPSASSAPEASYDLSAEDARVLLEEQGFRWRARGGLLFTPLVPYSEITHLGATERGFWLATRRRLFFARRQRFREADGPERLARDLFHRIARLPGGLRQLDRVAEIEHLLGRPYRRTTTLVVCLLTLAVAAMQFSDAFLESAGSFDVHLVGAGEVWRILTAHFIHGQLVLPVHFGLNWLGLVAFGVIVERALGPGRTLLILAAAGVAAMAASASIRVEPVVGASGLVAGLAGAALCLELHFGRRLPAWWRLPRRLFLGALAVQVLIDAYVPSIAGETHIGGFLAGYAVTSLLAGSGLRRLELGVGLRNTAIAVVLCVVAAFAAMAPVVLREPAAMERFGRHLASIPDASPLRFNELAWRMVTESQLDEEGLQTALTLAERAVRETGRSNPDLLDTLAEVLFANGEALGALTVIDEAIEMAPDDLYFQEQRRRFTGDRAVDDRPDPPSLPWFLRRRSPPTGVSEPETGVPI